MTTRLPRLWVGIDASKAHHWWVAVDDTGTAVWNKKIRNDEADLLAGLDEVLCLADRVDWAVDITGTPSALLLALLASHGQRVVYVPGRTVNRMAGAYRGEAKTDARDAYVIADTARLRRDFTPVEVRTDPVADLALLTAHRSDLIADRVRLLNRLHDVLTGISPALEAAFDYADHKGALVLLTGYQTPAALRRCGQTRLTRWLATYATPTLWPRPLSQPRPSASPSQPRAPRPASPQTSPNRSWPWTTGSSNSTGRSATPSTPIRRPPSTGNTGGPGNSPTIGRRLCPRSARL